MSWFNRYRKKAEVTVPEISPAMVEIMQKSTAIIKQSNAVIKKQGERIKEYEAFVERVSLRLEPIEKPDFLNDNLPYLPTLNIEGDIITLRPTDIYTTSTRILDIVNEKGWRKLYFDDKKACAYEIWKFVVEALSYVYDKKDDWRFSTVTLTKGKGDCEDGTILFLDLAREAGFNADEVFNACGWLTVSADNKFGHSFPILNYGDGWYIYESTLTKVPNNPIKFEGSKYDCSWGLANWRYFGHVKGGKLQI